MMIFKLLFLSSFYIQFLDASTTKGIEIKYYDDKFCLTRHGEKKDEPTRSWYLLDTCIPHHEVIVSGQTTSDLYTIQKDENGTLMMVDYWYSNSNNCTGQKYISDELKFGEYKECVELQNTGLYVRVEVTTDEASKISYDEVSISYYPQTGETIKCEEGKVFAVDFYLLNFCHFNGDEMNPEHFKRGCDDRDSSSSDWKNKEKLYELKIWNRYISLCFDNPDRIETHKLGVCDEGVIYDCKS